MSEAFLICSIIGLVVTVNALRPVPSAAVLPSFFASWLTMELAPQLLVAHTAGVAAFVLAGALGEPAGVVGLVLSALSAAGLASLVVQSQRVRGIVERALQTDLRPDYLSCVVAPRTASYDLRVPWRQLLLPFHMSHPDVERLKDIPYADGGRRALLDVYRNRARPAGCPVLLQIHGGAWAISNKNQQGKPLMLHLASRGWVCFAVNYPLSPRATWPEHVVAIKRAIAWIRAHGEEYGADPEFIAVTGGSAGGHLAALVALSADDPAYQPGFEDADTSVQACIPHYGVYDLTNEAGTLAGRQLLLMLERVVFKKRFASHPEDFERASPLRRVRPDAAPFFVIHGERDSLSPAAEARRFVEKLRAVSESPVVYAELPGAQHAFDVFPSIRTAHVVRAVERFADYAYCLEIARRPRHGTGS